MTLRRKTLLIIGLALAGLILLLYATASAVLLNSFNDLEAETAERNLERAANAIGERIAALDVITEDYAGWDDSYNYMEDRNQAYLDDNYYNESLVDLGVNLVAFYDTAGARAFGKAIDLNDGTELPLPGGLDGLMAAEGVVLPAGLGDGTAGIVLLDEGAMMLAVRPVLNSLGEGPSRGVMLFGRYLDSQEIESLSLLTNLEIKLYRPDEIAADASLAAIESDLPAANNSLIRPLSSQEIAGYSLLNDIEGNPALLLEVHLPRAIYQQGLASIRYLIFSLVAVGLVAGGVTLFLIERLVLARLARLSSDVIRIGDSGEAAERVTMAGRPDELSSLADEINNMLAGLERSQNSLRESEARYRAVIEQAAEGIFLIDVQNLSILEANQAFLDILGYTTGEITALSIYDLTIHDHLSVQETLEQTLQKGHHMAGEQRFRRKDGALVDVEVSASLITSGGQQVLCTVAHDITARKRADKELQRLLRETLLLNRVIAAAGTVLDPQDVLRTICEELALALHLPQAAFAVLDAGGRQLTVIAEYVARGRLPALGVVIPVADNPATQHVLETRQPLYIANTNTDPRYAVMRRVAEERGTVSLLLLPLLIRDRVVGTLGLNATEPREFTAEEMALAQSVAAATSQALENAQLYTAVQQELTERRRAEEEAQKAREVAENANQAKNEFISTVSHEMKVPMTAIKGYAELMVSGMAGPVSEKQASFLGIIQSNIERMTRLVSDLTDISHIESGRLRLDFNAVEIGQVSLEVAYSMQSQLEAKQQELRLAMASDLPPAWGDRNRLVQILINLVSNAHKYSAEGGCITLSAECITRQGGPIPSMEVIHVAVKDEGIGISPEDQQLLFQKFFRSGDEKARQAPGTGLGLSITKELVELQGGRIWFESEYRRGTTFHFIIPATVRRS